MTESEDKTCTERLKEILNDFADKTSLQGMAYIKNDDKNDKNKKQKNNKRYKQRISWTILLIITTILMGIHLYYLSYHFNQWPVATKISLGFSNLPFPAVTICNVNPIRQSKLNLASRRLQSLLAQMDLDHVDTSTEVTGSGRRRKRFADDFSKVNKTQFHDFEDDYYDMYQYDDYQYGEEVDERAEIMDIFYDLYKDENRTIKIEMGHQLNEMLLSCTVGRYKCHASNFTLLQHDTYGNCYTWKSDRLKISRAGPAHGMKLILYMGKDEYVRQINEGHGARVQIHDRHTYPSPEEEGFFVPSAMETQIGMRMVLINREDPPYGTCTNVHDYKRRYGFKYTRSLCQKLCFQDALFRKCGCYEDDASELNWQIRNRRLKYCKTRHEVKCMMKEIVRRQRFKQSCSCQNPCVEHLFTKTISQRNWPSEDYMTRVKRHMCRMLPHKCQRGANLTNDKDLYKEGLNYVKINIYYEDLNFEQIDEEPEIENAQFASDVGGTIGLWIGLSAMSIFELIQLCLECGSLGLTKCSKRIRKNCRNCENLECCSGRQKQKNKTQMDTDKPDEMGMMQQGSTSLLSDKEDNESINEKNENNIQIE